MSYEPDSRRTPRRGGFTLIELLVAIAILGILGTVVIREIWGSIDDAKQTTANTKVKEIETCVQRFRVKHNRLPKDLMELAQTDEMNNGDPWLSEDALMDPWDHPFDLKFDDRNGFEVWSYGENGIADGTDLSLGRNRDIGSRHPLQNTDTNRSR